MNMMAHQTSNVVDLLARKGALDSAHFASDDLPKKRELGHLFLQNTLSAQCKETKNTAERRFDWLSIGLVFVAHAFVIYLLSSQKQIQKTPAISIKTMLVSIVAPPTPQPKQTPEIVPINKQPKTTSKPFNLAKPATKKVIEKVLPILKPEDSLIEATTPVAAGNNQPQTEQILVAEPTKAPEKPVNVVEEKIEPPKFGVAYLNNPAPDYPPMSRRHGEEGRVLMKVFVSSEGLAETAGIEKSSGFDRLDVAAIDAVKRWRFIPAKKNNQPISAYVLVPMKFSLEN